MHCKWVGDSGRRNIDLAAVGSRVPGCLELVHHRSPFPTVPLPDVRLPLVRHRRVQHVQHRRDQQVRVRDVVAEHVLVRAVELREAGEALLDARPVLGRRRRTLREGQAGLNQLHDALEGCAAARAHASMGGSSDEPEHLLQ
jgi:hypothetical protein